MSRAARLVLWSAAILLLISGVARVRIDGDVSRFISTQQPSWQLDLGAALLAGPAGQLLIIAIEAPSNQEAARASRTLTERLRGTGLFATIHNGEFGPLAEEFEPLVPFRYLLSDRVDPSTFGEVNLGRSLRQGAEMLGDARGWMVSPLLPLDPTLETLHLAQQWSAGESIPSLHGVWFTRDRQHSLILGVTRASGSAADEQLAVARTIDAAAENLRAAGDGSIKLRYTGLGLLSAQARDLARDKVAWLGWVSATLVFAILTFGYRRFLPVALSLLPAGLGIAAGLAAANVWFGDVNILALAFACILIDEGSDYPSYLLTQTRTGRTIDSEAVRSWPTLRLAMLTSVAAFVVLLFAQFRGLQQLGLLCGIGLLVAGVAARWLLPALLGPKFEATWTPPRMAAAWSGARVRHGPTSGWQRLTVLSVPAVAALTLALVPAIWDDGIASINPLPTDVIAADRELRRQAGVPQDQSVLVLRSRDLQRILEAEEAMLPILLEMQRRGRLEGFDLAARYLPSIKTQQRRHAAIPATSVLRDQLQRAIRGTAFSERAFEPFLDSAARARNFDLQQIQSGLLRSRVQSLLVQVGDEWVGLLPIIGEFPRDEVLARVKTAVTDQAVEVSWFDPRVELTALLNAVRERLIWLLLVCIVVVTAVVAIALRSPRLAVRVMSPVVVSLLLTAACVRMIFGPLTAFHLVALMLVLGIVTNYSVFIAARSGRLLDTEDGAYTVFSLMIASATTVAVFGALALSGIRVVAAVGYTVVVGIIVGLTWLALTHGLTRRRTADSSNARRGNRGE